MVTRTKLHSRTGGHLGQDEDWWYLVDDDDGACYVEHEWSYVDPYGKHDPNSGSLLISIDDFFSGEYDEAAQGMLRGILASRSQP